MKRLPSIHKRSAKSALQMRTEIPSRLYRNFTQVYSFFYRVSKSYGNSNSRYSGKWNKIQEVKRLKQTEENIQMQMEFDRTQQNIS